MISSIIIFGLLSGHLLFDVLIGLFGSRRNIGFGWAFILSAIFTPLVGFLLVLLSERLPEGAEPKYGCLGYTFGLLGTIILVLIVAAILLGIASIIFPF